MKEVACLRIDRRHGMPFDGFYSPAALVNRESNGLVKGSMLKQRVTTES